MSKINEAEQTTVLIAIDWENIRRGALMLNINLTPETLCTTLKNVATIFGRPEGGKAFSDWTLRTDDAIQFAANDITPYQAPRSMAGRDRADPSILLEVYDWIRELHSCRTIILASGDSDFQVLIDRARQHSKRIVICAFSPSVARDMLSAAPLFPLEAELDTGRSQHGDLPMRDFAATGTASTAVDAEAPDENRAVIQFVQQMHQLETRLAFVGYNMLCNQWMLDWGIGWTEQECRKAVEDYTEAGIVERHDVPNPNNPDYPTAAVRLVRDNEQVQRALGYDEPPVTNPVIPSQGELEDTA